MLHKTAGILIGATTDSNCGYAANVWIGMFGNEVLLVK